MGSFGQLMICVAAVLSAAGAAAALAGLHDERKLRAGRLLFYSAAAAVTVSVAALIFSLITFDYRLSYVRDYADRTMSIGYLVTAFWGGQEGSLLLWAALQTWFTAGVAAWRGGGVRRLLPTALGFLGTLQLVFLVLVLFHSDPFEPLGTLAANGIGMNPLLRNFYMVLHPPTLYIGFVGFSVPLAFAFAALAQGEGLNEWVAETRLWTLVAWGFLSVGNILGMVWAYEELGWGGYWGWDPVENASFMPWLTGTALLHSAIVQKRSGGFRKWSAILALVTFALIVFGTFITRSGIIESVHAFAGATVGPYLLALIAAVVLMVSAGLILRRRMLEPDARIEGVRSKEAMFLMTGWTLSFMALFVWLATMAPFFAEVFKGEKIAVTPDFYNTWMVPLGLALLLLIGVCIGIWGQKKDAGSGLGYSLVTGTVAATLSALSGGIRPDAQGPGRYSVVIAVGIIVMTASIVVWRLLEIMARPVKAEAPVRARRRSFAAQLIHLSVVVLFIGFTGAAFTVEHSASMRPGEFLEVNDYDIRLIGIREVQDSEKIAVFADLEVRRGLDFLGIMSPSRHIYHTHPGQPTSEVVIDAGLDEDLFLVVGEADPRAQRAVIRAVVNPLVIWVWIGGALMILGTLLALLPAGWIGLVMDAVRRHRENALTKGRVVTTIFALGIALAIWLDLLIGLLVIMAMCVLITAAAFGSAVYGFSEKK